MLLFFRRGGPHQPRAGGRFGYCIVAAPGTVGQLPGTADHSAKGWHALPMPPSLPPPAPQKAAARAQLLEGDATGVELAGDADSICCHSGIICI